MQKWDNIKICMSSLIKHTVCTTQLTDHLVGGVLLEALSLARGRLARLVLRGPGDAVHHDGDDVLVDAEDADEVGVLEEHVVVHQGPASHGNTSAERSGF